jgi:hypothetical protein
MIHDALIDRGIEMRGTSRAPHLFWQIGPRIRVGGTLGQIGQNVKNTVTKAATDVGHAAGAVADNKYTKAAIMAGLVASGVGAPAAAAIMAAEGLGAGALKEGGGLKDALGGVVSGGLEGAAAGTAGGMLHGGIPSIGSAMDAIKGAGSKASSIYAAAKSIPGVSTVLDNVTSKVPGMPALQGATDFLGGGGRDALTALQMANAAMLSKKSSDYATNAMGSTQANWDERAPLRTAGQAGMLNPGAGIAPKIAGIPNRNPYSAMPPGPPQIGRAV